MQTQYIALAWFLILVTVGVIVVLSIAIVVKRRVARRKSRIDRGVYTPYGYGLSKIWKERVERHLNGTVRVRTEPRVFAICPGMEAPPIRGIHAFLMTARDDAMNPPAPRERIEEYCRLYLWARHDLDPFGEAEYKKLCEVQSHLMAHVARAAALHDSGASNTPSTTCLRRNSAKHFSMGRLHHNLKAHAGKSSDVLCTHSRSSTKSDLTRMDRTHSSLKSPANISLKRLSHGHRKGHELLVSLGEPPTEPAVTVSTKSAQAVYSKPLVRSDTDGIPSVNVNSANTAGQSRRGSCQSDGSQTALIDLEPSIVNPKSSTQAARNPRSNDAFEVVEKKSILGVPLETLTGSGGGLPGRGANC
ncbi:hypothetical protein T265_01969 [Opisthorchis viverrini]|uniref:NICE-3 protein n=1 Tax=Opisthorchis viverrini TaxID=6198 RepID=A0A075A0V5_OPIVI|nr:hypothetical protein T265_01969 [Opisthorchis viverrini]KER31882.1 hypothetical protein T265_01969 [Opisthorchis viverrini]